MKYVTPATKPFLCVFVFASLILVSILMKEKQSTHSFHRIARVKVEDDVAEPSPKEVVSQNIHSVFQLDRLEEEKECKVIYFIHVPKTGGTSLNSELGSLTLYHTLGVGDKLKKPNNFVSRGKNINRTIVPILRDRLDKYTDVASYTPVLSVASAEVGIQDLRNRGYPYWNETCFFSLLREPHEWLLSAQNHMNRSQHEKHKGQVTMFSRFGYFQIDDIQSKMVAYPGATHESKRKLTGSASDGPLVCAYTIERAMEVPCALNSTSVDEPASCREMGKTNVRPHKVIITKKVQKLIQKRYKNDLDLWKALNLHGGKMCWRNRIIY